MMGRIEIQENVKRRLYAESMGRCMNPNCRKELLSKNGDIIEKAHIVPYCETADNTFENLVVLCPNCHTEFDKNQAFSAEEVLSWKQIRQHEINQFFGKKFSSFVELKEAVTPLLLENKAIYENYYLSGERALWDKFENRVLINNKQLKTLIENNLNLFQRNIEKEYSNLEIAQQYLLHISEFEATRDDSEKTRKVLFPEKINSLFEIAPVQDSIFPSVESLEELIKALSASGKQIRVVLGVDSPCLFVNEDEKRDIIYLDDAPRIRQLYNDYHCFRRPVVRLDSLNFALMYIHKRNLDFSFLVNDNVREININGVHMIFVYEYCLSKAKLFQMSPAAGSVIVNLHRWNGDKSISEEAYDASEILDVKLLTMNAFYGFIRAL